MAAISKHSNLFFFYLKVKLRELDRIIKNAATENLPCVPVCLYACLSICLPACLPACLSACLAVWLSLAYGRNYVS